MNDGSALSSQDKARRNASKLSDYIGQTPSADVPRNQFGGVSRKAICRQIGVPPSTIASNKELFDLFDKLDQSVGQGVAPTRARATEDQVRQLGDRISKLENRIAALKAENELLKKQAMGSEHFLRTGRMVAL